MEEKKYKSWVLKTVLMLLCFLLIIAGVNIYIDPYFHYHKPIAGLSYTFEDQRYINNGITRNFNYEAIITGTSMTENFKTSEFEKLWSVQCIKVPFSGATYKEVNDNLILAFKNNSKIKYVVRGLDYSFAFKEKNEMRYEEDIYPEYLYDNNIFNDVKYVLNKTVLFDKVVKVLSNTKNGVPSTTFDEYSNWMSNYKFGKKYVLKSYDRHEQYDEIKMDDKTRIQIKETIKQNYISLAKEHPDTTFYVFFTPYSIVWWDRAIKNGMLYKYAEAEKIIIEELLEVNNIKLYSFADKFDLITDFDLYKDVAHYGENVNSMILEWMYNEEYLLTKNNYQYYLNKTLNYYKNYDYDSIFE